MPYMNAALDALRADTSDQSLQSVYLSDRRELDFFLWELYRVQDEFLGKAPHAALTRAQLERVLDDARVHATTLAAAYAEADRQPARLDPDGGIRLPPSFHALWREHVRDWIGFRKSIDVLTHSSEPGLRLPHLVNQIISEMFVGANPSFMTYAGFTPSGCSLLELRGTERQRELLLPKLKSFEWDACFCATEADAGTDLLGATLSGWKVDDNTYAVSGHKKYITAGMHDLTENTIYIVLGRFRQSAAKPLSLSCFLVPRYWIEADGSLTDNFVRCAKVEDKMGLNGCANTHLLFGSGGTSRAYLLGDRPHMGLLQLSSLMRKARIGTGQFAIGMASSAYLHSVRYARARVQGGALDQISNPNAARVAIVQHADVQRMLLDMRAKVEGGRALLGRISYHAGKVQQLSLDSAMDTALRGIHGQLLLLYGPVAKAYLSDEAWNVVTNAIQLHGAVGYLRDLPLEQYARDIKILSIWEGTNYIQSQDLILSKLGLGGNAAIVALFKDEVGQVLAMAADVAALADERGALADALACLLRCLDLVRQHSESGGVARVSQFFTRLLQSFGDVMCAMTLLQAAVVAAKALQDGHASAAERNFYQGKVKTARFFIENILPRVHLNETVLQRFEKSHVGIDAAELALDGGITA